MPASPFNPGFDPPRLLETSAFVLFPTDPSLSGPDYEAVMESRADLRLWSDSEWPADDFSLAENTEDLQGHVDDNRSHAAYGYMIFSPDRATCFGSLYLNPWADWRQRYDLLEGDEAAIDGITVRVDHWLRTGRPDLEAPILEALRRWFREEWPMRAAFVARPALSRRREACRAAGLRCLGHLRNREFGAELLLWADLPGGMADRAG